MDDWISKQKRGLHEASLLGEGGNAKVYSLPQDTPGLAGPATVKEEKSMDKEDHYANERIHRELSSHPGHLVPHFLAGRWADDVSYMLMELLQTDMQGYMVKRKSLDDADTLKRRADKLLAQMMEGVDKTHRAAHYIFHDMKLANFMANPDERDEIEDVVMIDVDASLCRRTDDARYYATYRAIAHLILHLELISYTGGTPEAQIVEMAAEHALDILEYAGKYAEGGEAGTNGPATMLYYLDDAATAILNDIAEPKQLAFWEADNEERTIRLTQVLEALARLNGTPLADAFLGTVLVGRASPPEPKRRRKR